MQIFSFGSLRELRVCGVPWQIQVLSLRFRVEGLRSGCGKGGRMRSIEVKITI